MPFALRCRLDPIFAEDDAPGLKVIGVAPDFTLRGSGVSSAVRDSAVPAKLEFVGRFSKSIRERDTPDERPLGELSGQLSLLRDPPRVEFLCDPDSLATLAREPEPPADSDEPVPAFAPRFLELRLGSSFLGLDSLVDGLPFLFIPDSAADFRYLEVFVRLTISGAIEAELEQSDVLDALIRLDPALPYPFSL